MAIKLLLVDDSALMRRQLTNIFSAHPEFILKAARNGREAVELNRTFAPDVITLDIHMPEMDGLTALAHIMAERPVPVIMVSSLTEKGALATFEALNLGAVDYIAKPGGTITLSFDAAGDELVAKVRSAVRSRVRRAPRVRYAVPLEEPVVAAPERVEAAMPSRTARKLSPVQRLPRPAVGGPPPGLVVIGVSTGGPRTLEEILPYLPVDFPWPVLVAQHMPAAFTGPFAQRLSQMCQLPVVEVTHAMRVEPRMIYLAKGGADMIVSERVGVLHVMPRPENASFLWHPSVELLAESVLRHCDARHVVGIMLTGMGHDGAASFAKLHRSGARTIAESEETAVVFGMPRELIERDGASIVLPADRIAAQLNGWIHA